MSRLLTPDQLRSAPIIGGSPPPPQRQPTLDEILPHLLEGLIEAQHRDLMALPVLQTYARLRDELARAEMPKTIISKLLPRVKISVSAGFVQHAKYDDVICQFAVLMAQFYRAVVHHFGEEGEELFLALCQDRFALVLPV